MICRVHLVTLHGAFPVEPDHLGQAFAAAAAPHGGHVVVKEWTVICGVVSYKMNCLSKCQRSLLVFISDHARCRVFLPKHMYLLVLCNCVIVHYVMQSRCCNRLPLTSAAVALAVQLVDGWGHVAVADALTLFTSITKCHVAWRRCRRLCEEESSINKPKKWKVQFVERI